MIKEIKLDIEKETLPQVHRKEPWGFELQVDIGGCNNNISDPVKIKDFIIELCDKIDMVRYKDPEIIYFELGDNSGYSCTQIIYTSLISAHFVDSTMEGFLNIFSCKTYDSEVVLQYIMDIFEPTGFDYRIVARG